MNKKRMMTVLFYCSIPAILVYILLPYIDTRPKRYCDIDDILLSKAVVPEDSLVGYRTIPGIEEPSESGEFEAVYSGNEIYQLIGRYKSSRLATYRYHEWYNALEALIDENHSLNENRIIFTSDFATEYEFACGIDFERYQCRFMATYNEYFIYVRSDISDSGITYEMFNDFLKTIDEKMSTCFVPKN